ncbi:conserved exported hypothetical protein [Tenacibaculum sp. 190524A05c]|uniref:hypothetical protein n=1 Tax=Tenacibaculum platacis TaxID=3137852 RepID=UPI0031FA7677
MRKITLFICLFITIQIFAQRSTIQGVISDNIGIVANAHVVNITSMEGTFSDTKGYFNINAQLGDILQITSIQHYNKNIKVSSISMGRKKINILLEIQEQILEEIEVKKTQLIQSLSADSKKTPENKGKSKSEKARNFENSKATDNVIMASASEKSAAERKTDPVLAFEGLTLLKFSLFTSKEEKRLEQRIKKQVFRDHLPERIITIVGKENFTNKLNIPEEQVLNFINYSIDEEIENNVQREEHLKVIENLKIKSVNYLKELGG